MAGFAGSLVRFRGNLIEQMLRSGHEVHALAPGIKEDQETETWLRERGVTCHDVGFSRVGSNPLNDLRLLLSLTALLRRIRPDVFIGYTIKPVVWGLIAAKLAGIPKRVALITGLGFSFIEGASRRHAITQWIARALYKLALRHAHLIFFQNPDDRDDFDQMRLLPIGVPIELVNGSGVDLDEFQPAPFAKGPPRFLLIARLLGNKGIREFALAAQALKQISDEAEFHLVGPLDPSPDAISEAEIDAWQSEGVLTWQGPTNDVRPAIAQSHIYVLPSYREGTPRTVLEAMAMGRPIVTTDAPGCRETVVHGENGFLVPVRASDALAAAMKKFIDSPDLIQTMGSKALELVRSKYDVNRVSASMLASMDLLKVARNGNE